MNFSASPFFSIIIPTLNEEAYIGRLLRDLSSQKIVNFEVLVVDARSSDQTRKIVKSYDNTLPLQLISSKQKNVGLQRNLGAAKARGKYLLFFDADIRVGSDYLVELKKQLAAHQVDFAATHFIPTSTLFQDQLMTLGSYIGSKMLMKIKSPFLSGQNLIFLKKAFIALKGFDATIVHGEDSDLVLRAIKKKCKGVIFEKPIHRISLRRFHREGRLKVISKVAYASLYQLFIGPIRKHIFRYDMGGNA